LNFSLIAIPIAVALSNYYAEMISFFFWKDFAVSSPIFQEKIALLSIFFHKFYF